MWQQLLKGAGGMLRQPLQHVAQIGMRVVATEFGGPQPLTTSRPSHPQQLSTRINE